METVWCSLFSCCRYISVPVALMHLRLNVLEALFVICNLRFHMPHAKWHLLKGTD